MARLGQVAFAILLFIIFFQVVIGFPISLEQTSNPANSGENITGKENLQIMKNVRAQESLEGSRDWELYADEATGTTSEGRWNLKVVKVQFYSSSRLEFVVTGQRGWFDSQSKDVTIEGDVVTKSANGYVFNTQAMEYTSSDKTLRSQSQVKVTGPTDADGGRLEVKGGRLETLIDAKEISIQSGVTARRGFAPGRAFTIQSGQLKLSGQNTSAHFSNSVRIEVDSMRIDGPEARFAYRNGTDLLQSVLIQGGVKVSDVDKYATAEIVRFDPESNQFVLSGHPRLVQNQDELAGEQITFIDGGKKVKVESQK